MAKKKQTKEKFNFRFSRETSRKIDRGVNKLKKVFRAMDRTKFLEYLVDEFWVKNK